MIAMIAMIIIIIKVGVSIFHYELVLINVTTKCSVTIYNVTELHSATQLLTDYVVIIIKRVMYIYFLILLILYEYTNSSDCLTHILIKCKFSSEH